MRRKIHVTYDVRMLGHSGIGTQVHNVLTRLAAAPGVELELLGNPTQIGAEVPKFSGVIRPFDAGIYSIREQLKYPAPARDSILLVPHYNAPLRYLDRAVVVLHDLIHLHSAEFRRPDYQMYARLLLSQIARRALRIVAVSEFTANDFLDRFPAARGRTLVNPNGIDHDLFTRPAPAAIEAFRRVNGLPKKFLLCVGIGKRHKNVDFVIRALLPYWKSGTLDRPLVLAGTGGALPAYLTSLFEPGALQEIRVLPKLDRADLPLMYASAEVLIMPSLMEGFGFPVAEAMACQTPVLCSNAASLPEVGGKAAEYFDPRSTLDFADRLFTILKEPARTQKLAKLGPKQAGKFRWDNHTRRLISILSEI